MALIERLMGLEQPRIPVHQFYSMLAERKRGRVTNAQVIAAFALGAADQTELLALWALVNANTVPAADVDDVLLLAEQRIAPYDTAAAVRARLGL